MRTEGEEHCSGASRLLKRFAKPLLVIINDTDQIFLAPEAQLSSHVQKKKRKKRDFCAAQATFCFKKIPTRDWLIPPGQRTS